jgi:uncharacterized protein YodC (DUF2158 family)
MRASPATVVTTLAVTLALGASGCGGTEHVVDPLLSKVDLARDAQALSSIQQTLVTAALVRSESGEYGSNTADFAQMLQAKDPSHQFSTGPTTTPDQIQVLEGGPAMMLMVKSVSNNYIALWDDGAGTLYYRGTQPPAVTAQRPTSAGWSDKPPH